MGYLTVYEPSDDEDAGPPHLWPMTIGVDVGKMRDPTAVAVAELDHRSRPDKPEGKPTFLVRRIAQLPLGTSYPDVAARLVRMVDNIRTRDLPLMRQYLMGRDHFLGPHNLPQAERRSIELRLDATGVGRPLLDLISDPLRALDVRVRAVTFRPGEQLVRHGDEWAMGKTFLVDRLQVVFQANRVQLPARHPFRSLIVNEMMDYELRLSEAGKLKAGAMKPGSHDDLVTALGLAVLTDPPPWRRAATAAEINAVLYGDVYGDPWDGGGDPYGPYGP